MFASSAPYVLTILVSVASWLLMTFNAEMNNLYILKYTTSKQKIDENTNVITYTFSNISPSKTISNISVVIRCPDVPEDHWLCIEKYDVNYVRPWAMTLNAVDAEYTVEQPIILPPNMSFEARVHVSEFEISPLLLFKSIDPSTPGIRIVERTPATVWLANNFLKITIVIWILSLVILGALYASKK